MDAEQIAKDINKKIDALKDEIKGAATPEQVKEVSDSFEAFKTSNEEALKGYSTKMTELTDALKKQGEDLTELLSKNNDSEEVSLKSQLSENKDALKDIIKGGRESLVVKANTLRTSIASDVASYNLPDLGQIATRKLTMYDLFPKYPVSESNNQGVIRYWDWDKATIVRAAAAVAEGVAFAQSTAKWLLGTIPLQKIGDTLPVSAEFEQDEAQFTAELGQFLDTNVSLEVDRQIALGAGAGTDLVGLQSSSTAFVPVASGITDPSIYDLLVKVSEKITSTGGSKYMPDFAVMNIVDINKMKLKKDSNNNYIIPPFVSRSGANVSGINVIESNIIAANTMVVGDRRFARIYEKGGIEISRGEVNAQFTEDMMTLKARKRLAFLIRGADKDGFMYVSSISAALVTLAI